MKDMISACAAGKVGDTLILDPMKEEDNFGDADLPIAISPRTGDVLLLQMDGHLTFDEFNQAFDLAIKGCHIISDYQKKAIIHKYQAIAAEVQE